VHKPEQQNSPVPSSKEVGRSFCFHASTSRDIQGGEDHGIQRDRTHRLPASQPTGLKMDRSPDEKRTKTVHLAQMRSRGRSKVTQSCRNKRVAFPPFQRVRYCSNQLAPWFAPLPSRCVTNGTWCFGQRFAPISINPLGNTPKVVSVGGGFSFHLKYGLTSALRFHTSVSKRLNRSPMRCDLSHRAVLFMS
jgi:hypothetical protein